MAKLATTTELRKMPLADLHKEIKEAEVQVAKLRLGVKLRKEKDTAKYVREKKQLARMKAVRSEKQREELQSAKAASTVAAPDAPAKAAPAKKPAKKTSSTKK